MFCTSDQGVQYSGKVEKPFSHIGALGASNFPKHITYNLAT